MHFGEYAVLLTLDPRNYLVRTFLLKCKNHVYCYLRPLGLPYRQARRAAHLQLSTRLRERRSIGGLNFDLVAFPAADFEQIEAYAREHGLKISELIRKAALYHVQGSKVVADSQIVLMSAGVSLEVTAYFQRMMPSTGVSSASFLERDVAVA